MMYNIIILTNNIIIITIKMQYFSNLFWYRTLHVYDRFTVHHLESSTVYAAIGICHTVYADCLLARSGWNCVFFIIRIYHDAQSSECQICQCQTSKRNKSI